MSENLVLLGIVVIVIGIMLIVIGSVLKSFKSENIKTEGGFLFFIGPIPIGFATSKEALYFSIFISIIAILIFLILIKGIRL